MLERIPLRGLPLPPAAECKRLRKGAGISQQELADYLGVCRQTLNYWETGRVLPRAEYLLSYLAVIEFLAKEVGDDNDVLPPVAERRRMRERAGLTQYAAAEEMGIKQPQFQRYESGWTKPTGERLARYQSALERWEALGDDAAA